MANLTFVYRDRVVNGAVTASTELANLPAINLQHPFLTPNRWRSTANAASINTDFGSSLSIGGMALLKSNLTATATFRLRLSNNSNMSSPLYDTGATEIAGNVDTNYGHLIHILPSGSPVVRYMQLDVTDTSLTFIEAGRLWAGVKFQPARNYAYGYRDTTLDSTRIATAESGQSWVEIGFVQREIRLRLEALTDAENDTQIADIKRIGRGKDILVVLDPGSSNLGRDSIFGLIAENLTTEHGSMNRHALDLVIWERK